MKKTKLGILGIAVITAGLLAFNKLEDGSVKGTVTPPDGAIRAWVLSAKDTFRTGISSGSFEFKNVNLYFIIHSIKKIIFFFHSLVDLLSIDYCLHHALVL